MTKKSCRGCSYYDLFVIDMFPFEHCYKHNWSNKKPMDFRRCEYYTTSKWVRIKVLIKSIIGDVE